MVMIVPGVEKKPVGVIPVTQLTAASVHRPAEAAAERDHFVMGDCAGWRFTAAKVGGGCALSLPRWRRGQLRWSAAWCGMR